MNSEPVSDPGAPSLGAFPYGLIPLAVYFVAVEYSVISFSRSLWPLPRAFQIVWDGLLMGANGWRATLSMAIWDIALLLAIVLGAILIAVAFMRRRLFRRVLVIWLALGLVYLPVRVLAESDNGWTWPNDLSSNLLSALLIAISCGGMLYALRSRRLQVFFNR